MFTQVLETAHQAVPALNVKHLPQLSLVAQHEGMATQMLKVEQ